MDVVHQQEAEATMGVPTGPIRLSSAPDSPNEQKVDDQRVPSLVVSDVVKKQRYIKSAPPHVNKHNYTFRV